MIIHINTEEPEMRTFVLSNDEKSDLQGSIDNLCKCYAQLTLDFLSQTVPFEHCIEGKNLIFGVASDYFDKLVGGGFADTPVNE